MKLVRHGSVNAERPGLIDKDGKIRDLSDRVRDIDGAALSPEALSRIAAIDPSTLPVVPPETRLGPPVAQIGKCICTGPNYY